MRNFLINSALALAVGVTSMPLLTAPVIAQELELRIGPDGPRVRTRDYCDEYDDDCRGDYRAEEYRSMGGYERRQRGCTEDRALDKAERMGIRRARILSAGRRTIEVGGRARGGDRVAVVFGRERGCPVYG
jgi:hypothetical protein